MSEPPVRWPLADRQEAGRLLAARLEELRGTDAILLALPRGGVLVAAEMARTLELPLDVLVVRKVAAPEEPEYGLGSVTEFGDLTLDTARIRAAFGSGLALDPVIAAEREEAVRRARLYRRGLAPPALAGRTAVLVDDGVATGVTLDGAIRCVRSQQAARAIVAVGVGPPETIARLRREADQVVCLATPPEFFAVGGYYRSFEPVSDDEVLRALASCRRVLPGSRAALRPGADGSALPRPNP